MVLHGLLTSKKGAVFLTAVSLLIAVSLKRDADGRLDVLWALVALSSAYMIAQGLADIGKHRASASKGGHITLRPTGGKDPSWDVTHGNGE